MPCRVGLVAVFTFGIGADASEELVRGLADAGNGVAEFVTADQPLMDAKSTSHVPPTAP